MAMQNHYELLGVKDTAGIAEIRSAYRKIAVKLHPDRNPGNKEAADRFSRISAAYQVLSDPRTREVYDRERRRTSPRPGRRFSGTDEAWGPSPIHVRNPFQRGPIQVTGGFPMPSTTIVIVNGVVMPGVRIFRPGSSTTASTF